MKRVTDRKHLSSIYWWLLSLLFFSTSAFAAHTADDFDFPPSIDITGQRYQLCSSADMQVYLFLDIGDVALYLADCHHRPLLDQGRLLYFHYNRHFSAADFRKSGSVLLKRNVSHAVFSQLQKPLQRFNQLYLPVDKGDSYIIGTNDGGQMALYRNGKYLGKTDSQELSQDYFQIWFGSDPFNTNVKADLAP
jgi:hypothetical protein